METLKFKTNIKCSGCIAAVTPHLNGISELEKWQVDMLDPDKILTVDASKDISENVIYALNKAGYKAERLAN